MQHPVLAPALPIFDGIEPFVTLEYADWRTARRLLAEPTGILGVVGYGAGRPECLPMACPFIAAPLAPAAGGAAFEIWRSGSPARFRELGPVAGACSDDLAFGVVTIAERATATFEAAVEDAYLALFDFLDATGFQAPVRFWNYLTAITGDDGGLERYMRFNTGRQRAFSARLRQSLPPAASGVGGHQGASVIYFLAARAPAKPIENPRQVSAYKYPPIYGPRSPSFSRASLYTQGGAEILFISGTASIVGHESRHCGDLAGQIAETAANLRALIGAACLAPGGQWAAKIYLREPAQAAAVDPTIDELFGPDCQRLYLHGDICRSNLLVEIEAFRS